jgi:hypothetical protein
MAVNITIPELKETQSLPRASGESLRQLREEMCSASLSRDFKLQNYQRFLRRVMSPDSPTRGLLMVHGTGTGKTCTAIQIAEEYIIRPEFQEKTVLVLANPAVQENFKSQIFNMSKVSVDPDGYLLSKQCTGRRYLDMLLRIQSEPMKWTDKATKERMNTIAQNIIKEFYEFQGYTTFANNLQGQDEAWIHKTFDNRLIIIDEAHNMRVSEDGTPSKISSLAIETIIKVAKNVTLILLTATPLFDDINESIFYFNLFLWNDRKQKDAILPTDIFTKTGAFKPGMETLFRGWCQDYISFIKGDNPLTFPFRLPPPANLIADPATKDIKGKPIPESEQRDVLTLTGSFVQGIQADILRDFKDTSMGFSASEPTICVFPENKSFRSVFSISPDEDSQYDYVQNIPPFLSPSRIANHSSKFALIMNIIKESKGVIFVYSNLVDHGAQLFSMCLEEHGYESALGSRLLKTTANEIERGSAGKYILLSTLSDSDKRRAIDRLKSQSNKEGKDIKIVVASPAISEGIDLSFVRQVHVLEYWWNMSRIEQVVGRGIRTCSHQALPFEDQNCTVYLHVCKLPKSDRELIDEYYYRTLVEAKAKKIAKVKQVMMESAMDCPLQEHINTMPDNWKTLEVSQTMSQGNKHVIFTLSQIASPMFGSDSLVCKVREAKELPGHERPLSAYLDVRDEILDIFIKLFKKKPVWLREDLFSSAQLKIYDRDVLLYTLQSAIETGFQLKDNNDRVGHIESKGSMYAFTVKKNSTMQERYIKEDIGISVPLTKRKEKKKVSSLETKRTSVKWSEDIKSRFSPEVLDWYIIDHILTPQERLQHMLSIDWDNPPIYAMHTANLKILGLDEIYNSDNEKITPIGEEADEYNEWVKRKVAKFIETKNEWFATMNKNNDIIFNLDNKAETLQKAERSKVLGGMACTSFSDKIVSLFAEWLGTSIPLNSAKTKPDRCQFLSLLVRDAIMKKKSGIIWWTPEEWAIFNEPTIKKELLLKLKM